MDPASIHCMEKAKQSLTLRPEAETGMHGRARAELRLGGEAELPARSRSRARAKPRAAQPCMHWRSGHRNGSARPAWTSPRTTASCSPSCSFDEPWLTSQKKYYCAVLAHNTAQANALMIHIQSYNYFFDIKHLILQNKSHLTNV